MARQTRRLSSMLLLLTGEGSTDIGSAAVRQTVCGPGEWQPGPMAVLANQLYEKHIGYSALNTFAYFVPEAKLTQYAKTIQQKRRGCGQNLFHKKSSHALALLAFELSSEQADAPVVAVFFRDCDGTRTTPLSRYDALYESIKGPKGGFGGAGLLSGVPMLPKPKSEAWLLCAVQERPYEHCSKLEELPGNDNSPKSVKKIFQERRDALGNAACTLACRNCEACVIRADRIDMPSFKRFAQDLDAALGYATHGDWHE